MLKNIIEINNNFRDIDDSYFDNYGGLSYPDNYLKFTYPAHVVLKKLKEANIRPNKILDAGCASGELVADFIKLGIEAIGIDNNREILKKSVCPKHTFFGDIRDLDNFKNDYFDVVYANSLMYLMPQEIIVTLKKIHRVCSQGVFLCNPFLGETAMKSDVYRKFLAKPAWWDKQFIEAGFKKFNKEIYLKI
jgi:SAM-dependent methyltransferase